MIPINAILQAANSYTALARSIDFERLNRDIETAGEVFRENDRLLQSLAGALAEKALGAHAAAEAAARAAHESDYLLGMDTLRWAAFSPPSRRVCHLPESLPDRTIVRREVTTRVGF